MEKSKKRILFVLQDLEIGGAEQLKLSLEKYINKDKYLTVYCCIKKIGRIGAEIIKRGGDVISLNSTDKFYNLKTTYKLYKLARKINPDLIHSALFNANFHARVIGVLIRTPVIIEEHGMYTWKRWYHIFIDRLLIIFTYKVIVPSRSVRDFLVTQEGLNFNKIVVLFNCIDPESLKLESTRDEERKKLSVTAKDFVIGAVGNLRREKGYNVLLNAFKKILARYSNVRLFVVGDGPLYMHLVEKAKELAVEKNVIFLGRRTHISGFLKALDLFVMPSLSEGLGIALIESIFAGVPSVASKVGGIREVAEETKGVTLVEPDNVAALSCAIIKEIENRRKNNKSMLEPKMIGETFGPEFYINHLEKIYHQALN